MALRCLYTDLDGTLLGKFGGLFRDAEGNFSRMQALTFEACHRADVEVVIMSGRREAQIQADARLFGQTSYIYEAGCGMVIDGERTFLSGEWVPDESGTPAERIIAAGGVAASARGSSTTRHGIRTACSRCSSAAAWTPTRSTG